MPHLLNEISGILLITITSSTFWPINQAIDGAAGNIHGSKPATISKRMPPSAVSAIMLTPSAQAVRTETVTSRCEKSERMGRDFTWFQ